MSQLFDDEVCYRFVDLIKTEKGSCDVNVICIRLLVTIIIYSLSIDNKSSTRCLILLSWTREESRILNYEV